jgi:acetylornithine deacetylase
MTTAVELLEKLVEFDTTSRNSNLALVDFVEQQLVASGAHVQRLPDSTGGKAALVASFGPSKAGGVVLCGHTDVVPIDGQPWTRPAFKLTQEGDRLYGRGTTDMKGFLASALAAAPAMGAARLQRPIVFALTYDEEIGCLSADAVAAHLVANHPAPAVVVTGEPTSMTVVRAHKGVRVQRTTVTGRDAHSSRTDVGSSAIVAAARLVAHIDDMARQLAAGPHDARFVPPYTTVNVGIINGGQALNIVPRACELLWEFRSLPGVDPDTISAQVHDYVVGSLLPELRANAPEASVVTELLADVPALTDEQNEAAASLIAAIGGLQQEPAVAYGTDGSALQLAGLPTIVCGPGSMEQGHRPDEYVEVSQLDACDELLRRVVSWCEQSA